MLCRPDFDLSRYIDERCAVGVFAGTGYEHNLISELLWCKKQFDVDFADDFLLFVPTDEVIEEADPRVIRNLSPDACDEIRRRYELSRDMLPVMVLDTLHGNDEKTVIHINGLYQGQLSRLFGSMRQILDDLEDHTGSVREFRLAFATELERRNRRDRFLKKAGIVIEKISVVGGLLTFGM